MENRAKFSELGIDVSKIKTSGKTLCPKCSHTRKHKNDPCLSVDVDKGVYNCHNCEFKGYISENADHKVYAKPTFVNNTELSEKTVNWFFKRGISQKTLIEAKVTENNEYMPQVQKERNAINFNYFRSGELINIKYRDGQKNFKMFKDAELIFYNLDSLVGEKECLIVEGEIDCLSWMEAGYKPVISVPNGASKGNARLDYLDGCIQYFEDKERIYIGTDNDEAGRSLMNELVRRLGAERCRRIDFEEEKDSNDYLQAKGAQNLLKRLEYSREFPLDGIVSIDDVWDDVLDYYENGLPKGSETGDLRFDEHLRFILGELTMVTGIPGHGKSIFLDQIAIKLVKNENWKFGVFSPESNPVPLYYTRLIKRLLGKKFSKKYIVPKELELSKIWLKSNFNIIKPESFDIDSIIDRAKMLVRTKGINALIIDPWNRILNVKGEGFDKEDVIISRLSKIINFAQQYKVHVFLVAHPTKMKKKEDGVSDYVVPSLYDISGSAHFFNMTQNGITVYRSYDRGVTEVHIQKVKWEHLGKLGSVEYMYSDDNSRFYHDESEVYENWLYNEPAIQANFSFEYDQSEQGDVIFNSFKPSSNEPAPF